MYCVTFKEFLTFVLDTATWQSGFFWRPVFDACAPCNMNYEFVGKMETFEVDFESEKTAIYDNAESTVKVIINSVLEEIDKLHANFDSHWKTIPLEMVQRFIKAYKMDFQAFGYVTPLQLYLDNPDWLKKEKENK